MGLQVLVDLGLFLFFLFSGLGVLLAGLGIMYWGDSLKSRPAPD